MERKEAGRMSKPGLNSTKKTIHHHRDHRRDKSKSRGVWRLVTLDMALEQRRNLERAARREKMETQNKFMEYRRGSKLSAPPRRATDVFNTAFIATDTAPITSQLLNPSSQMFYKKETLLTDHSSGYVSDFNILGGGMSNLSIDEEDKMKSQLEKSRSGEIMGMKSQLEKGRSGERMGMKSHLSLNDLKICKEQVYWKSFEDINMLIPTQGFGIESQDANNHILNLENAITIETRTVNIQESIMRSGLRVYQVSPIICVKPYQVKFCPFLPAIVQVPLTLDPSSGDEVCCLHSTSLMSESSGNYSDMLWSFEAIDNCWIRDDKVCFETFQLGCFVLVIRPKCSYNSRTQDVNAKLGGSLEICELPSVQVSFPEEVSEQDIVRVNAKIYFDTEQSVQEFLGPKSNVFNTSDLTKECLATPIIQIEPHGTKFEGKPVLITLPVPDYDSIMDLLGGNGKLSVMQSDTHPSAPSRWEKLNVDYQISRRIQRNGEKLVLITFPVTHFSLFKGVWNTVSGFLYDRKLGMSHFFRPYAMKCQANMQEGTISSISKNEVPTLTTVEEEGNKFGLVVFLYQKDKPPPRAPILWKIVGQHITPKLVKPGKISIAVKSNYLEPDKDAGEEVLEDEIVFQGHDIETQLAGKVKPGVKIKDAPFGKVVISRQMSSSSTEQGSEKIFIFNLQKQTIGEDMITKDEKVLMEFANCLYITEDRNWKTFANECGMSDQDIVDANLRTDDQPLEKILKKYLREGGADAVQRVLGALYRCYRKLNCGGGRSFNKFPRSSHSESSLRLANIERLYRSPSNDSEASGTSRDSGHSGSTSKRKRSYGLSFREPHDGIGTLRCVDEEKRRLLFNNGNIPRRLDLSRERILESEVSTMEEQFSTDPRKLNERFVFEISRHLSVKWKAVGRSLALEESTILDLEHMHGNKSLRELAHQMLLEWLQRFPRKCTFGNLYCALKREGLHDAASRMNSITLDPYD